MSSLYIIGDSFSAAQASGTWPQQVADQLGLELKNFSLAGTAQDWALRQLQQLSSEITPRDRIVVALTHANRFWYKEEHPQVTNAHIENWQRVFDRGTAEAAEGFLRYLQRPELDLQWVLQRLAWLAYQTRLRGWARPLILLCFPLDLGEARDYDISVAMGDLYSVSQNELTESDDMFRGFDPRYCHLSLRNHRIMADKIASYFLEDQPVDLGTDFHRGFFGSAQLGDREFCDLELDPRSPFFR